jgi:hypothetical protein
MTTIPGNRVHSTVAVEGLPKEIVNDFGNLGEMV